MSIRTAGLLLVPAVLLTLGGCAEKEFALADDLKPAPACVAAPLAGADGAPVTPGFGCATTDNLKAMLVNPADLDGGAAPSAPPSGDAAIGPASRYRQDKVKPLPAGESPTAATMNVNLGR